MVPLATPNLSSKEAEYAKQAIESGWISGNGPFVERLEAEVAEACGRKWCVATVTGTAAIHLALAVLPSFECRSMTYIATANAISYHGMIPYLLDIEPGWKLDWCPVGQVTDAAPSIGQHAPGDLATLSFNANKTITTGQGGAVLGDNPALEREVRYLANVANAEGYNHTAIGFNYLMPNVNAAIGCAQMERLPEFLARKDAIMARYRDAGLKLLDSRWMAVAEVEDAKAMLAALTEAGIKARPFWRPLHMQPPYANCPSDPLVNTDALWERLVCLPCSTHLTKEQQDRVIECISQ